MSQRFPTLMSALSGALEATINQALQYDPASRQRVSQLTQRLLVECSQPPLNLSVCGGERGVQISHVGEPGDTTLSGSAVALVALLTKPQASLANSDVTVSGNLELLQQWQSVLSDLDIDWQGWFSRYLGDTAGGFASQAFSGLWGYAKQQQQTVVELASHYFSDERQWVPHTNELDQFYSDIDQLSLAADRLDARVSELQRERARS